MQMPFRKILLFAVLPVLWSFSPGTGEWFKAGSARDKYVMGLDKSTAKNGAMASTIQSAEQKINGFGTLMTELPMQDEYAGRTLRLTGYMRCENVEEYAGFWFRADAPDVNGRRSTVNIVSMQEFPVKGTVGWKKYALELEVYEDVTGLAYGAILSGTGKMWFADVNIRIAE